MYANRAGLEYQTTNRDSLGISHFTGHDSTRIPRAPEMLREPGVSRCYADNAYQTTIQAQLKTWFS